MLRECTHAVETHDCDLMYLIKKDDDRAFVLLYDRYWNTLLKFANPLVRDPEACQEIVQNLFIHLYNKKSLLKVKTSIRPYLYGALRNRIANYLRSQATYKKHLQLAASKEITANTVEEAIRLTELKRAIEDGLKKMTERYREVYVLNRMHQYSIREISMMLHRPADTVEKQLRKATHILQEHLMRYGIIC